MATVQPLREEAGRALQLQRVTLVGAAVNVALTVAKLLAGWLGQSAALVADGVHSLSDLLTDALVLVVARHSAEDADDEHPYGHARFETAATVGLGAVLALVAVMLGWDAVRRLLAQDGLPHPGWLALSVAFLSIAAKEALYHYTVWVARRTRSNLLKANAWHHRSDAISSVVVLAGIGGAMVGFPYLDAVAALLVAVMVAKIGWDLGWQAVQELVDTALEPERVEEIRRVILSVDGVADMHLLKTRRMGGNALVDVHILLEDPRVSVSEGHQISETVRGRLIGQVEDVADVMVHIDPEDDERSAPNRYLPLRRQALASLEQRWQGLPGRERVRRVILHYLRGRLHVELDVAADGPGGASEARRLAEGLASAAREDPRIGEVEVRLV